MENNSRIINWDNVFKQSKTFQNNKPFRFGFIEEFFTRDFYEKLYEGYPKIKNFLDGSSMSKSQLIRWWGDHRSARSTAFISRWIF